MSSKFGRGWLLELSNRFASPLVQGWRDAPTDPISLSQIFVDVLLREDNQHLSIVIYGPSGSGKSTVALAIGDRMDQLLCEKTGEPRATYFSLENVAGTTQESVNELYARMQVSNKCIFVFDEGTTDIYNRESMSKNNRGRVRMEAVMRSKGNCIFRCIQMRRLADPQILDMATHEIQIVKSCHAEGYNVVKVKAHDHSRAVGRPYTPHLRAKNGIDRIVEYDIPLPLSVAGVPYGKYVDMRAGFGEDVFESVLKPEEEGETRTPKQQARDARCLKAWERYSDVSAPYLSAAKCAQVVGVSPQTFVGWVLRNGYTLSAHPGYHPRIRHDAEFEET